MESEYVSVGKASKILGVCIQTVRKWVDEGKLKSFITPTKHRRVSLEDIKRLMVK